MNFRKPAQAYKVDHHFPGTAQYPKRIILYASLGSAEMEKIHPVLKKKAVELKYDYIVRHNQKVYRRHSHYFYFIKYKCIVDCGPKAS